MALARFYDIIGGQIKCHLCAHECIVADGNFGLCGVRYAKEGRLHTSVYGRPCTTHVDPIEKKPLFHFLPGSKAYSIATVGCNLRCGHCQNHSISQVRGETVAAGFDMSAEEVVEDAIAAGCASIAYTYTEPTIFLEYALDICKLAAERGLRNVFVSNGFMTKTSLDAVAPYLSADNVDLKSFSDDFYSQYCGARLEPVLKTLEGLIDKGIWVEVTTLVIPTLNDSEKELSEIASYICENLGAGIPWHISRFHPDHKLVELPPTDPLFLKKAVKIGLDAGLKHVYTGNVPHQEYENTRCTRCKKTVIERQGYEIVKNNVTQGICKNCGEKIEGVWE